MELKSHFKFKNLNLKHETPTDFYISSVRIYKIFKFYFSLLIFVTRNKLIYFENQKSKCF